MVERISNLPLSMSSDSHLAAKSSPTLQPVSAGNMIMIFSLVPDSVALMTARSSTYLVRRDGVRFLFEPHGLFCRIVPDDTVALGLCHYVGQGAEHPIDHHGRNSLVPNGRLFLYPLHGQVLNRQGSQVLLAARWESLDLDKGK